MEVIWGYCCLNKGVFLILVCLASWCCKASVVVLYEIVEEASCSYCLSGSDVHMSLWLLVLEGFQMALPIPACQPFCGEGSDVSGLIVAGVVGGHSWARGSLHSQGRMSDSYLR